MRWIVFLVLVACGPAAVQRPTERVKTDPYPLARASTGERRAFELLNLERAQLGLRSLAWSGELALAAQRGASRLRESNTLPLAVANFAAADTIEGAHAAVMADPKLRENVLSPRALQAGVGLVVDAERVALTHVIMNAAPVVDSDAVVASLRAAVMTDELEYAPALEALAKQFAAGLAAGGAQAQVWEQVKSRIGGLDRRFPKITYSITQAPDLSTIGASQLLGAARVNALGIGVAQGPQSSGGTLWIVVVMGQTSRF